MNNNNNNNNNDNDDDLITCRICGFKSKRIYGRHLKSHGITSDEYKKQFPGAPLYSKSDNNNTSKNSGKHMKQEKYKKMFSEKIMGEKNPNHTSKTTIKERKSRSPFSKDFINYDNEEKRQKFIKEVCDNKPYNTRIEYWLDKGFNEEEAEEKLKERQTTFSLEICIEKYGDIKGKEVYDMRQQKWQKSLIENGNLKCGYSKVSQDFAYELLDFYNIRDRKDIYFATKNQEYYICKGNGEFYQYDFTDLNNKKIIEYNGDQYHGNPLIYESNDTPHPFRKNITAQEIWDKDERKIQAAKDTGFEVLVVWDSDYKKNKDEVITKCRDFLKI